MKTSLIAFKKSLTDQLLNLLWNQWCALGVAGHPTATPGRRCIDPEALLLMTCSLGRREPRLFDEALDWLAQNGDLVSVQRATALLKQYPFAGDRVLGAVAGFLSQRSAGVKWRSLTRRFKNQAIEPLFFFKNGRPMAPFGSGDPGFEAAGFARSRVQLRGMSGKFDPRLPACLGLRLRALLGSTARSETVLYLVTHPAGAHPRRIARETGYAQKAIHNFLVSAADSALIERYASGREVTYVLAPALRQALTAGLAAEAAWQQWPPVWLALERLWLALEPGTLADGNPTLLSAQLRRLMTELLPLLDQAGFREQFSERERFTGADYVQWVVDRFQLVLHELAS